MAEAVLFISCVSDDFEKASGAVPGLRSSLFRHLDRAGCKVEVQENFRQVPEDTLEKIANYIKGCSAVIHLVGALPGSVNAEAVAQFLATEDGKAFLTAPQHADLRARLGDFSDLSYTQWEAFLAFHFGVPLFVYATEAGKTAQAEHLDRLKLGERRYASVFEGEADLLGQLIGDLKDIVRIEKVEPKFAPSRILRHSPGRLFGRESELDFLDDTWAARDRVHVLSLVAWGGVGKTSLVAHWVAERLAARGWPDVERYFDWSFYSQGTGESRQSSADLFISQALTFFGDPDPTQGGAWDRGARLAGLVKKHRALLVLDGIEPLQYPPGDPQAGRLKDQGLAALLAGLAAGNPGLCLVTSRETLADLKNFRANTAPERKLDKLLKEAAVALLRHLQVVGSEKELAAAWEDAGGHALTLRLLGRYLADAHGGDVRKRKEIDWSEADAEDMREGRSAFKVMLAYERWWSAAGPERARELAVLRLTGLFDRPISPGCLKALRAEPPIEGLTDALSDLTDAQWNKALGRLIDIDLISHPEQQEDAAGLNSAIRTPHSELPLDAHPLVREYFAKQLRETQPEAFKAAHSRLFDHLCESAPECTRTERLMEVRRTLQAAQSGNPMAVRRILAMLGDGEGTPQEKLNRLLSEGPSLDDLQPLYQAVVHGCLAGRHQEACDEVYAARILRGTGPGGAYSTNMLGAVGADLAAVAAFFEQPWSRLSPNLSAPAQAWLVNEAATRLRALGRLTEAVEPMRVGMDRRVETDDWQNAAISASNLSELEVTLGRLGEAKADARRAVEFADRSGDAFWRMGTRTTLADALAARGGRAAEEARALFAEAEAMQREDQPEFDLLYSLPGFRFCDLLLAPAERTAWRRALGYGGGGEIGSGFRPEGGGGGKAEERGQDAPTTAIAEAERRGERALEIVMNGSRNLLDIALNHLTLARAALYRALLEGGRPPPTAPATGSPGVPHSELRIPHLDQALDGLRKAGQLDDFPRGLLTAALYRGALADDAEGAAALLAEAQDIAERGPMPLHLADVHLHRARLFRDRAALAEARRLIDEHGYGKRLPELEDAEAAAEDWGE